MENNKEFIEILKNNLTDTNHELVGDYFYEWKIENWSKISNETCVCSPYFEAYGHRWKLELYPKGVDDFYNEYVSLYLNRDNEKDDCGVHIPVNRVFFIRNYNDKYCYRSATLPIEYLSKSIPSCGHPNLIKKTELFTKTQYSNKPLIENNKCIVGVYFQIYKKEQGLFKKEITCFVDDEDRIVKNDGFYEWEVGKWNRSYGKERSPSFVIGDHRWSLELYRDGDGSENRKYVSVYLVCLNPEFNKEEGTWVNAILYLRNCEENTESFCFDVLEIRNFNRNNRDWGFSRLIKKKALFESKTNKPVIENGKCIVGVYLHIYGKGKLKKEEVLQSSNNGSSQHYPPPNQNLPPYSPTSSQVLPSAPMQQYPPYQYPPPNPGQPPFQGQPPYQYPPPNPGQPPFQGQPPYQYPPLNPGQPQYPPPNQNQPPSQNQSTGQSQLSNQNQPPSQNQSTGQSQPSNQNQPPYQYPPYQYPSYQYPPYQYPPYQYPPYQYPPYQYSYNYPPLQSNQNLNNAPMPQYPQYPNQPFQDPPPSYYAANINMNQNTEGGASNNQEKRDPK